MKKEEFLSEIKRALGQISDEERAEILYDYEEHFAIGMENGKTEEEICLELGDPKEIAHNYLSSHLDEGKQTEFKEENRENRVSEVDYKRRNMLFVFALIAGLVICIVVSIAAVPRHNNSFMNTNGNGIEIGGFKIDSSGIHGNGINIDNNGVEVPGVKVDDNGVQVPGVSVDSNGVKVPGVNIDSNGVKIDLPNVKINLKD